MTTGWSYRIVRYRNDTPGEEFGLHEVYYDDEGQPWGMTEHPVGVAKQPTDLIDMVSRVLDDIESSPVLQEPEEWPGKAP